MFRIFMIGLFVGIFGAIFGYLVISPMILGFVPWLPGGRVTIATLFAMGMSVTAVIKEGKRHDRHKGMQLFAANQSLGFHNEGGSEIGEEMRTMIGSGSSATMEYQIHGRSMDAKMVVGDLKIHYSGENSHDEIATVAYFKGGKQTFPHFVLQPETRTIRWIGSIAGISDINFDQQPDFSAAYHLSGDEPDVVRRLFDGILVDHFAGDTGWEIRAERKKLLIVGQSIIEPDGIEFFIEFTKDLYQHFVESADRAYAEMASQDVTSTDRAGRRKSGSSEMKRPSNRMQTAQLLSSGQPANATPTPMLGKLLKASMYGYDDALAFVEQSAPRTIPKTGEERRQGCATVIAAFFLVPCIVMGTISFFIGLLAIKGIQAIPFLVIGALFAVPAIAYLYVSARKIWRRKRVLRDGLVVPAKVVSVSPSKPAFLPDNASDDVEIQYQDSQDSKTRVQRVRGEQAVVARRVMEDGETTPLLIDPSDRENVLLAIQMVNQVRMRL